MFCTVHVLHLRSLLLLFDELIRGYILPPFFVYGYLLPKFIALIGATSQQPLLDWVDSGGSAWASQYKIQVVAKSRYR